MPVAASRVFPSPMCPQRRPIESYTVAFSASVAIVLPEVHTLNAFPSLSIQDIPASFLLVAFSVIIPSFSAISESEISVGLPAHDTNFGSFSELNSVTLFTPGNDSAGRWRSGRY